MRVSWVSLAALISLLGYPPEFIMSAATGTQSSSGSSSQPSGKATLDGEPWRPRAPSASAARASESAQGARISRKAARELTLAKPSRTWPPTGKPRRYQPMCLRISREALSSPSCSASSSAWRRITWVTSPRVGSAGIDSPRSAAPSSAKSPVSYTHLTLPTIYSV